MAPRKSSAGKGDILLFHRPMRGEADILGPSLCTKGVALGGVEKLNVPFPRSGEAAPRPHAVTLYYLTN